MELKVFLFRGNGALESTQKLFVRVTRNTRDGDRDLYFSTPISCFWFLKRCGNDPSAGSPTETLLRLHLPLNDEV